jgi:hypothetical protein
MAAHHGSGHSIPRTERKFIVEAWEKPPRRRVSKSGKILLGKDPIPCTVQNISDRGACLKVPTTHGIPAVFDFLLAGEAARTCKTIWRDDTQIGVMFIQRE